MNKLILGQVGDHPTVIFAASEIKRILKCMDPSLDIETVSGSYNAEDNVLWVGLIGTTTDEINDTVKIDVKGSKGIITGSNIRSVLISAYRFLKELGCRFVRPGANGEIIPEKRIEDLSVSVCETASYPHRGVCIEGSVTYDNVLDMIDFLPKVGMNEYFIQFMVPTEFFARWYEHRGSTVLKPEWQGNYDARSLVAEMTVSLEKEIKKRSLRYHKAGHGWTCEPFGISGEGWDKDKTVLSDKQREVLAEVGGKRELWGGVALNTNLCYSNDDVRNKVTDSITEYAANNPHIDVIHFWLADDFNNHCECENCIKKRPSDWYFKILNELDEKMSARGINTKIVFLIYVDLLWEPETERFNNPERFILMFAPITRNYGQNYGDFLTYKGELPTYVRNRLQMPASLSQNIEHLRSWQALFKGDSFDFDYHLMWAHVGDIGYEKAARNLFCDMKDLSKIGLGGMVSCQIQRCFYPTALPFLSMAAALWDNSADFDALADDYYNTVFGGKAAAVRRAMKALSDSCHMYENTVPVWDEAKALKARDMLAEVNAGTELSAYTEYLDLVFALFKSFDSNDKDSILKARTSLFEWLWQNETALQPVLDAQNTVGVFTRYTDKVISQMA